ncbi:MAG: TraB/GumN family protein [Burkholderiaceae bacterium]|nr:TraB/GumN family protein [Burkholderiaceae bacterium]
MRRLARAYCLGLVCCAGLAQAAPPATCPPTAQMPGQEQLMAGMRDAQDRGVLWRIAKDGRDSYLYGTLHVGRQDWIYPGPALQRALQQTAVLALELDVTDPAVQAVMTAPTPAAQLPVIGPALQRRLDGQAALACLPPGALAGMHPVLQVMTYALLAGRWDGLDPSYGQEFVLAGFAKAGQRPLISLETALGQRDALIPNTPAEALEATEQALELLEGQRVRPQLKRLAEAWARGDLAELAAYEDWCDCIKNEADRRAMRRLNDARNPAMAERIAALHAQGKPLLAAVGALHMTGPQALPRLLAERGFTVERVQPHK